MTANETPNTPDTPDSQGKEPERTPDAPREIGGPKGPEPTRYNDWEQGGRCTDF